jgi:hypothetical protein
MNIQRIAVGLAIFAASFLLSTQSAWALCDDDNACTIAPYTQCVNAHCINPSCTPPPPASPVCIPSGGIDDVLSNTHCCSFSPDFSP